MDKQRGMIQLHFILFVFFIVNIAPVLGADTLNTQIELRTYLKENSVPLNKEVIYHIELRWKGDLNRYKVVQISEPVIQNLKLRGSGSSNKVFETDSGITESVKTLTYYFTPVEMGMAYIDGITVQYENNLSGEREELVAQRVSVKIVDSVITSQKNNNLARNIFFILIFLFLMIVLYFIWRYFRIQKRTRRNELHQDESLEDRYLRKLRDEIKIDDNRPTELVEQLLNLCNKYFKEKYNLSGAVTFDRFEPFLGDDNTPNSTIEKMRQLYRQAELSKFAREKVNGAENQLFYDTVEMTLEHLNKKSSIV
ncbi:MAG: hypothetical protein GF313_07035 [Caldithrix sp.]|nr:hypothetical protein [Caldithrix sp.]